MRATRKSNKQAITTVAARQNFSELINRLVNSGDVFEAHAGVGLGLNLRARFPKPAL